MEGDSAGSDELPAVDIDEQPLSDSFALQGARSSSAAIFDYGSLSSPADILLMAEIANAAYEENTWFGLPVALRDWKEVLPGKINLSSQDFEKPLLGEVHYYKADPSLVGDRGRALVLVNDVTHTVALSFRGTDQIPAD